MVTNYIGNLSYETTEDDLRSLYSDSGTVTSIAVIYFVFSGLPDIGKYY